MICRVYAGDSLGSKCVIDPYLVVLSLAGNVYSFFRSQRPIRLIFANAIWASFACGNCLSFSGSILSLSLHRISSTMAKGAKSKKNAGGRSNFNATKKDQDKGKTKGPAYVPKYRWFAKRILAAYPDEDGVPIYLGDAEDEKKFFKKGYCLKVSQPKDCELFGRIGMALNLAASSFDVGAQTLRERVAPIASMEIGESATEGIQEKFKAFQDALNKLGLLPLHTMMASAKGAEFGEAVHVLNAGRTKKPKKEEITTAVKNCFSFLGEHEEDLRKCLPKVATFAAKTYLFSMTLVELLDFYSNKIAWANRVETDKKLKHGPAMKTWLKEAQSEEKFLAAVVEAFAAKVKKNKKEKTRKRKASQSSSNNASESSSSDSNSENSSSSDSSASKDKKAKKGKKEKKASSGSDSDGDAKKEKKDKK